MPRCFSVCNSSVGVFAGLMFPSPTGHARHFRLILGLTSLGSIAIAALVAIFADRGNDRGGRLVCSFAGFGVAIVWIMAIADEVVNILQVCAL